MRPSRMGRLPEEDFRFDEPTPFVVVPRGKRGRLAAIPLVGDGLDAAREFVATGAWGALVLRQRGQGAMIYTLPQLEKHVEAIERLRAPGRHRRRFRAGTGWQNRLAEKQRNA